MSKIRNGFVSNSSSSSFIVSLDKLSGKDLSVILEYPKRNGEPRKNDDYYYDSWDIEMDRDNGVLKGFTTMDNDDLDNYLRENNVSTKHFSWQCD